MITEERKQEIISEAFAAYGVSDWGVLRSVGECIVDSIIAESKESSIAAVFKRIEEYAPEPIDLPEFDLTKKSDYLYCVEWGMKKAKRNEFEVYQKMLKDLKERCEAQNKHFVLSKDDIGKIIKTQIANELIHPNDGAAKEGFEMGLMYAINNGLTPKI
jgi:hypothetical protein